MYLKDIEAIRLDDDQLFELKKLVAEGEGLQLEFKRKASYPEKIVRELVAFANTEGGTLLVGVDDDKTIPGVKYPEEESYSIQQALQSCKPKLIFHESILAISDNRFVVRYDVPQSEKRPHFIKQENTLECFVREADKSIKASREMQEIVKRSKKKKDVRFMYGEYERQLMQYLHTSRTITLTDFCSLTKLNRFKASRKLILLVLANVLKITATEKGDVYSRY
ncbi:MAG: helix-turn-helix domain-containing protein [Bacteroidota bacterium]|jgi:predicted HTH transcriptional regulator|nr:ATP-binding protein [Cytophagales bacterium]MCE2956520.1 ATP-binding protein [Flammeovirgaceae bacterium]MCZ8069296.1 ATP-binding protein [Cytophagales bacterium]